MARLIRAYDWQNTPLGPLERWPQSLRTATSMLVASPVPIVMLWGQDGVMLYNDAYSVFAGGRHPQLLGSKVLEGWPEVADFNANVMRVGLAGGTLAYRDTELTLHRHGVPESVWMNLDYSPVYDESGQPAGVIAIVVETTDRVLAERRTAAELKQLWTLSEDLLARADYGGDLTAVNPAWTKVFGWTETELLTNPYADIIHQDNVEVTVAALQEMGRTGQPTRFENRVMSKDGVWKPIGWTVSPEPGSEHFIAIGRDLTEDKAREAELLQAQESLRQSQKMEAVGQLTGGLAHDFNNILAGITGSLQLMQTRIAQGRVADVDRYVNAALGAAKRAASLTQRLLAFSRRQTLDPQPTDLNKLVAGMEDLISRSVGPQVELETVASAGLWTTFVDPGQLENALLNLCINARDAMPEGGKVTIETANRWLDERAARERSLPPGQYVSLCVSDTGTGMTPDVIARAFDPFYTTKPIGQGTGLGLSMVYGFAGQSGGTARIYSELGQGSMVCIYVPRHVGAADSAAADVDQATSMPRADGHETILVVDDEPLVRMIVVEQLQELGYAVLEAGDAPSALRILDTAPPISLLVTDVGLPGGMNGRQLADAVRQQRQDLTVLFITGYAENAVLNHGHLDHGMHVMTKPFAVEDFARRISDLLKV